MTFKDEFANAGKILANKLKNKSRKESGCHSYKVKQDINNENTLIFIEKFYNNESLERHKETEHVKKILKEQMVPMIKTKIVHFI